MTWAAIAEQFRAIGVEVPSVAQSQLRPREAAQDDDEMPFPSQTVADPPEQPSSIDRKTRIRSSDLGTVTDLLTAAKAGGVRFFEHVANGDLEVEDPPDLTPDLRNALHARRDEIQSELIPNTPVTASLDLLARLGIELIFAETEQRAAQEAGRMCSFATTLGLDLETAPRPEFLPVRWPIAITKDGRRSKNQMPIDRSAGLDPFRAEVRLLQVAAEIDGRMVALVIDLRRLPLTSPALAPLWSRRFVGHNMSFDAKMLLANSIKIPDENVLDTILMSGLVLRGQPDKCREGSRRPSLAIAIKEEALGLDLPKEAQCSPWWRDRLTEEQVAYAALDAVVALRLATALQPRVDRLPSGAKALSRLCQAVMPVARMELAGITLDREGLTGQIKEWEAEIEALKTPIGALEIQNPASALQVEAWLRRELTRLDAETGSKWLSNWPPTPSGALSTQAKHLRRVVDDLPGAKLLVRYSGLMQRRSNFGDKLLARISGQTGRLHGNFKIAAAKSGRFSSSEPNLQNIPNDEAMRSVFVAAPGRTLVVADYSQLEMRVMAEIAQDQRMRDAYRDGLDLHAVTAAGMLGIRAEEFDPADPAHRMARGKAKAVNFGVLFGSGRNGIREFARDAYGLTMSLEEAGAVIDHFLATYPGVAQWQRAQTERTRRTGSVSTLGGRVYRFAWEPKGEYKRNLALNLPIQGTAAEIALEAVIRIDRRLRLELTGQAHLVLQVHDEFVVEVVDDLSAVMLAKKILEEEMRVAFGALLADAPTTGLVDAHAGRNWAEAKR